MSAFKLKDKLKQIKSEFVSKIKSGNVASNAINQKLYGVFVDISYSAAEKEKQKSKIDNHYSKSEKLLKNWEKIEVEAPNKNDYHYKAEAFINQETKQIVIANAGTKPKDYHDLIDDAKLATGFLPSKITSMVSFINGLENIVGDLNNYEFHTTGHSLGAVLSDLCSVELGSRGLNVKKSLTYDSPGSKNAVEKYIKDNQYGKEIINNIDFEVHNVKPNFINTNKDQLGKVHLVVNNEQLNSIAGAELDESSYWSKFQNKAKSLGRSFADKIGFSNLEKSINQHKLTSFLQHDHTINVKEWCSKSLDGQTELEFNSEIKERLFNNKIPSNNIPDFFSYEESEVEDEEDTISIDSYSMSYDDLQSSLDPIIDRSFHDDQYEAITYDEVSGLIGDSSDIEDYEFG
jgi:hypothetical protein